MTFYEVRMYIINKLILYSIRKGHYELSYTILQTLEGFPVESDSSIGLRDSLLRETKKTMIDTAFDIPEMKSLGSFFGFEEDSISVPISSDDATYTKDDVEYYTRVLKELEDVSRS